MSHGNKDFCATPQTENDVAKFAEAITDKCWREFCFRKRKTFSSTTTYLSQLLAHDFVRSVDSNSPFDLEIAKDGAAKANLRRGPLLLDTLYGEGMHTDHALFENPVGSAESNAEKFRILTLPIKHNELNAYCPGFSLKMGASRFGRFMEPILADRRNRDNAALLMLTPIFMAYHNLMVECSSASTPGERFVEGRIRTILAWHKIIRNDVIDVTTLRSTKSEASIGDRLSGPTLQAAFRCFHTLVLPEYRFRSDKSHPLGELLKMNAVNPEFPPEHEGYKQNGIARWAIKWAVDWDFFATNQTCFTPSLSAEFAPLDIFTRDIHASQGMTSLSPKEHVLLSTHTRQLAADLRKHHSSPPTFSPTFDRNAPLLICLLAEAHVTQRKTGKLGRIGSTIVRHFLEAEIAKSRAYLSDLFGSKFDELDQAYAPRDFSEMYDEVNSKIN